MIVKVGYGRRLYLSRIIHEDFMWHIKHSGDFFLLFFSIATTRNQTCTSRYRVTTTFNKDRQRNRKQTSVLQIYYEMASFHMSMTQMFDDRKRNDINRHMRPNTSNLSTFRPCRLQIIHFCREPQKPRSYHGQILQRGGEIVKIIRAYKLDQKLYKSQARRLNSDNNDNPEFLEKNRRRIFIKPFSSSFRGLVIDPRKSGGKRESDFQSHFRNYSNL